MKLNMINMAYRNVARQGKRSLMLALSMAFGVMIITLVNSLTVGMANSVESNFSKALGGHVYISGEIVTASNRNLAVIEDRALVSRALAPLADRILSSSIASTLADIFSSSILASPPFFLVLVFVFLPMIFADCDVCMHLIC